MKVALRMIWGAVTCAYHLLFCFLFSFLSIRFVFMILISFHRSIKNSYWQFDIIGLPIIDCIQESESGNRVWKFLFVINQVNVSNCIVHVFCYYVSIILTLIGAVKIFAYLHKNNGEENSFAVEQVYYIILYVVVDPIFA